MHTIKFSGNYPKLWDQQEARLLDVVILEYSEIGPKLKEYDTKKSDGTYYKLPKNRYLQLVFVGDCYIPFCTLRRYTPEKWKYYTALVGQRLRIEVLR